MLQFSAPVIALGALLLIAGCKPSPHLPKAIDATYGKIELGMPFNEAKTLFEGPGEPVSYDNLPAAPKPREIYSKLPQSIEWQVWAAPGKPTWILGVLDEKIVFKQVFWTQDGERKGNASALPAYQ